MSAGVETPRGFVEKLSTMVEPEADRFDPRHLSENIAASAALLAQIQNIASEAHALEAELAMRAVEKRAEAKLTKLNNALDAERAAAEGLSGAARALLEERSTLETELRAEIAALVEDRSSPQNPATRHDALVAAALYPMQECLERMIALDRGAKLIVFIDNPLPYEVGGRIDLSVLSSWLNNQIYRLRLAARDEIVHEVTFSLLQPFNDPKGGGWITYFRSDGSNHGYEEDLIPADFYSGRDDAPSSVTFPFEFRTRFFFGFGMHIEDFPISRVRLAGIGFGLDLGPEADDVRARLAFFAANEKNLEGPFQTGRAIEVSNVRPHWFPIDVQENGYMQNASLDGECVIALRRQVVRSRLNHLPQMSMLGQGLALRDIVIRARVVSRA